MFLSPQGVVFAEGCGLRFVSETAMICGLSESSLSGARAQSNAKEFHGQTLQHKHYVDFLCKNNVLIECKAVESLGSEHRQQLWNYMRLTQQPIGILVNFAPVHDQCEHYYLDYATKTMYTF